MKKIAIFSGYYLPHLGGVERYTYNLARKLCELENKIIIITLRYDKTLSEIEENEYAKIYRLPIYKIFKNRYPIVKNNRRCKELLNLIKNEDIDSIILQTRFWTSSYIGAKFAKRNSIPACVIEHGSTHFTVNNKLLDFFGKIYEHILTNLLKKNVKDFYGVSKKCTEWLEHFKIKANGVFYNAIDKDELNKQDNFDILKNNKNIKICFVARLIKEKGIEELIDAFIYLRKKYDITLYVAGDGPLYKILKEKYKDDNSINILGKLPHEKIMKLLWECDIFVHPSRFPEGLPTSILEAGLMKCAVIASPMGGTTEIIKSDDYGLICDSNVESIKEKLQILLKNKKLRKSMSKNIQELIINQFSWESTAKKVLNDINFKERS